jgi:hypothetical protein
VSYAWRRLSQPLARKTIRTGDAAAKLLTKDEARRIAVNIAKLPDILAKPAWADEKKRGRLSGDGLSRTGEFEFFFFEYDTKSYREFLLCKGQLACSAAESRAVLHGNHRL